MSTFRTTLAALKANFDTLKATTSDPEAVAHGKVEFCRGVVEAYLAEPTPPANEVDAKLKELAPVLAALDETEREAYVARLSAAWGAAQAEPPKGKKGKAKVAKTDPRLLVQAVVRALGMVVDETGAHYLRLESSAAPIESTQAKALIASIVQGEHGVIVGPRTIDDAILPLRAETWPRESLPIRVGGDTNERVVIDLADATGNAIVITADDEPGVVPSPICFTRPEVLKPLPTPIFPRSDDECAAVWGELWSLLRVETETDRASIFAWLMASARRAPTYALLCVSGPEDSGKTTKAELVRSIIDPVTTPRKNLPEKLDDLVVGVREQHTSLYDNVSKISLAQSDTLCLLLTGGAWSKRKLHTDGDNFTTKASRPLIIASVTDPITQSDLLSRSLIWRNGVVVDRVPEDVLDVRFAELHPRILGAVCYCLRAALRGYATAKVDNTIRLLACAQWGAAAETSAGFEPRAVERAYLASRADARAIAGEDPVVVALVKWMATRPEWRGTATVLLEAITDEVYGSRRPPRGWPESPRGLSQALNRHTKLLAERGMTIERSHSGERSLTIKNAHAKTPSTPAELTSEEVDELFRQASPANTTETPPPPSGVVEVAPLTTVTLREAMAWCDREGRSWVHGVDDGLPKILRLGSEAIGQFPVPIPLVAGDDDEGLDVGDVEVAVEGQIVRSIKRAG